MKATVKHLLTPLLFVASAGFVAQAQAVAIDFTGGTATLNDGSTGVTNNNLVFQDVASFEDQGFKMEFVFASTPTAFASIVGDYYSTGNDVIHFHWDDGRFGEVTELRISRVDGALFDLGGFRVSTNTSNGGSVSTGTERTWVNSSKANEIFLVAPDNWGLGSGPDPLITIDPANTLLNDIAWFSFTNDAQSTAVGLGLDNFFLDEAGDPGGTDPTDPGEVPAPATPFLFGLGLAAVGWSRRKKA